MKYLKSGIKQQKQEEPKDIPIASINNAFVIDLTELKTIEELEEEQKVNDLAQEAIAKKSERRKYDPAFKGPIDKRGCTDVICCVLISAYMIGMIVVGIIAFVEGDPSRLLYATDSNGKVCGVDHPDKKFLQFFDLTDCILSGAKDPLRFAKNGLSCPTPQVCVKDCPGENKAGYDVEWNKMTCVEGVTIDAVTTMKEKMQLIIEEKCAPYYLDSQAVFYRCMPQALASAITSFGLVKTNGDKLNGSYIQVGETAVKILLNLENLSMQILDEMKAVWVWVLIGFVLSMMLSILYIVLARWITFPLVILTMIGVLGLIGYGIYYVFAKYLYLNSNGSKDIEWRISISVDDFSRNKTTWLIIGIILCITFVVLLLIIIFMIPRVRIACALIALTSRAVCSMLSTLFFPLLPWLFQLAWFAWFLIILMYPMSNGRKQYQVTHNDTQYNLTIGDKCDHGLFISQHPNSTSKCLFAKYDENPNLLRMHVFHFFGWLWGSQFIIAFAEASLAGVYASYYWAYNKNNDIPCFPVLSPMWKTLSYHTGSLALGAAIVAIMKLIRVTLEYIHKKLKGWKALGQCLDKKATCDLLEVQGYENTDNPVANFVMKCLKCCFWCLDKCIRFLNKNAYIMIAIYGRNFCSSAKEAFSLLIRNPDRVLVIDGITGFILFLGKLLVTGGVGYMNSILQDGMQVVYMHKVLYSFTVVDQTPYYLDCKGVASFFWFAQYNAFLPTKLNYTVVPILICIIGAYLVTVLFFNVYDMGVDTLFLCFSILGFLAGIYFHEWHKSLNMEDLERNDGSKEKPYCMTKELMQIMHKKNKGQPAEDKPRVYYHNLHCIAYTK